jgi:hypothetical protein
MFVLPSMGWTQNENTAPRENKLQPSWAQEILLFEKN